VIDRYTRRWRYITIFATLIVVGILPSGGRFLQFTNDHRVFYGESNPQLESSLESWYVDFAVRATNILGPLEAARRLGESWKLDLELQIFDNVSEKDRLFGFEDDDFLRLDFGYFI